MLVAFKVLCRTFAIDERSTSAMKGELNSLLYSTRRSVVVSNVKKLSIVKVVQNGSKLRMRLCLRRSVRYRSKLPVYKAHQVVRNDAKLFSLLSFRDEINLVNRARMCDCPTWSYSTILALFVNDDFLPTMYAPCVTLVGMHTFDVRALC